jgi:hypothetical protein
MKFTVDDLIEAIEAEHEYNGCPEQYTEQELRRLALAAVRGTVFWFCADCDEHTIDEYYMVGDDLWADYGAGDRVLCIGCLEIRIGRRLTPADFTDCGANKDPDATRSARLRDRLGLGATHTSTDRWTCCVCGRGVSKQMGQHARLRVRRPDGSGWDHTRCRPPASAPKRQCSNWSCAAPRRPSGDPHPRRGQDRPHTV